MAKKTLDIHYVWSNSGYSSLINSTSKHVRNTNLFQRWSLNNTTSNVTQQPNISTHCLVYFVLIFCYYFSSATAKFNTAKLEFCNFSNCNLSTSKCELLVWTYCWSWINTHNQIIQEYWNLTHKCVLIKTARSL